MPGLTGYFMFDDTINIVENAKIAITSLNFETLKQAAFSGESSMLGRPIAVMSFAINYYFSGLNPYYFKLTNIIIHLCNGLLIFLLTNSLLKVHSRFNKVKLKANSIHWMSLTITASWLFHPFNLTSVLYIVQRMTSLAAFFTFASLVCYVYGRQKTIENSSGWFYIAMSVLIFPFFAVMSKENGALLPLFLLLTEISFFRFRANTAIERNILLILFTLVVALPSITLLIYLLSNPNWLIDGYSIRDYNLTERVMTEMRILWFYTRMIIAPSIIEMGMYHDDISISKSILEPISTLYAIIGIVLLSIIGLLSIKRYTIAGFGILLFLIGHSMESTVLALELVHEHRNYIPDYGLLFAIFYYLLYPLSHQQSLNVRSGLAFFLVLLLATITFLRAKEFGDPVNFKIKEVEHHPESIRANIAIAAFYDALPAVSQTEANDFYQRAYNYNVKAAELSPTDTLGLFGLIALDAKRGIKIEDSWINALVGRIKKYPLAPSTSNSIASLEKCVASGSCKLQPDILEDIMQAALQNSSIQDRARIQILFARSDFLFRIRQQPDLAAIEAYRAIAINPNDMDNQITLISMLINMKKTSEAKVQIDTARQFDRYHFYTKELNNLEKLIATHFSKL